MGKRKVPDLYKAPFPLFSIKVDPNLGLVIVAGGGGASKTGIKNAVQFLDLQLVGEHQYSTSLVHSHDTDTRATMNMAVGDGVIAAGQDGTCHLMKFKDCKKKEDGTDTPQGDARHRAGRGKKDAALAAGDAAGMKDETVQISLTEMAELQSDLNPKDPFQKVVRFSPDLSLLMTGGTDGHIRVWEFPSLKKKFDFKAHEGEIEDLDMSPGNKHLVTVGKDFTCSVWSGNQLVTTLKWHETTSHISEKTYQYRACRYGKLEDQEDALRLYTVQIPHKRDRRPPPCYLTKWDGKSFLPMMTAPCGSESISCMVLSDSGTFLGLGTVTGSVAIYIAFSLQKLYYVQESHGLVVTDLAFLPNSLKGRCLKGNNEAAMFSVAVDNGCQVHVIPNRRSYPVWLVIVMCGLMVVVVVLLLQLVFPGFF
ncbi:guanine nucleotide-exchange factor SEC12 isoform 1-T2 [Synchiropus picturatus]